MEKGKNVLIIGVGGVGGYFGGLIANKIDESNNQSYKIHFIARGEHLKQIEQNGLLLNTNKQKGIVCRPSTISSDIKSINEPDIIILAVKSYDLPKVLDEIHGIVAENTVILPLMNGIDIYERIRNKISKGIILPTSVYVTSEIEKPGVVCQKWNDGHLHIGADPKYNGYYPNFLIELLESCGITYEWSENAYPNIWEKYMLVASYSMVTAAFDIKIGDVFADFNLEEITRQAIIEIFNLGQAKGIDLQDCTINDSLYRGRKFPNDTKTFYQRDIETKGKLNESDIYGETLLNIANELNIEIPIIKELHHSILDLLNNNKNTNIYNKLSEYAYHS